MTLVINGRTELAVGALRLPLPSRTSTDGIEQGDLRWRIDLDIASPLRSSQCFSPLLILSLPVSPSLHPSTTRHRALNVLSLSTSLLHLQPHHKCCKPPPLYINSHLPSIPLTSFPSILPHFVHKTSPTTHPPTPTITLVPFPLPPLDTPFGAKAHVNRQPIPQKKQHPHELDRPSKSCLPVTNQPTFTPNYAKPPHL